MPPTRNREHKVVRSAGVVISSAVSTVVLWLAFALIFASPSVQAQSGCRELMVNGGFENGHDGWVEYSSLNYELIDAFWPHTGTQSAWLVANNEEEGWIAQTIVLPADAGSLKLSYWWSVFTEENPGGGFDYLRVQLLRVDNTLLTTLATYDSGSAEAWLWNPGSADLSAYAGQTLKVRFQGKNDTNNPTSFFADDVSLQACDGANPPTSTPSATTPPTPTSSPGPTVTPRARVFLPLILR